MSSIKHMAMTKGFLINAIRQHGAKEILVGWEGTDEDAISAVESDPREVFCNCDCKKDERGACTGQPMGSEQ